MTCKWKENWEETRENFCKWWNREGLVLGGWMQGISSQNAHEQSSIPAVPASVEEIYTDAALRGKREHYALANRDYPADMLPFPDVSIGPGSLALFLGSKAGLSKRTVWFDPDPAMESAADPEELPPLKFDPDNYWWKITEDTLRTCVELAGDRYIVGCPDLVENIDILASLRGAQTLLMDMIERPDWICTKVREINQAWFEAYDHIYDIIKLDDGSSAFHAFRLWGPGKTAKVQCDAAAMFSPAMFEQFVVPSLTEQCEWLDYSIFHLDGTQCIPHLDLLLEIDALDAIEWTPQAGTEQGGNSRWYDMYKHILDAGKALQVMGVKLDEMEPLLKATGGKGVYIFANINTMAECEKFLKKAESYR